MKNTVTKILLKTINILFLYNVLGTSYGCLFGLLLLSLQNVFALYIPLFGMIKWYGFIAFGVLTFNIPPIIKKKYTDPKIETRLKYTREILEEGNFGEKEKRIIWRDTIISVSRELSEEATNIKPSNDSNNLVT